jgi:hypothetical protein
MWMLTVLEQRRGLSARHPPFICAFVHSYLQKYRLSRVSTAYPAQLAFLSLLDATAFPPNTIFVFTGNDTTNLESRFMSRVRLLEFSSYGIAAPVSELLQRVWQSETHGKAGLGPNFQRLDGRCKCHASRCERNLVALGSALA